MVHPYQPPFLEKLRKEIQVSWVRIPSGPFNKMKLKNKIVLVTGASRGIGRATALLLAKEGAKVVVNYNKSEKEANELVRDIKNVSEGVSIKCDVSDEKQVKSMIESAIKKFGRIDILINNAGIVLDTPFEKRTLEQFRKTLDVNLVGAFLCSKYAIKHMPKGGVIINISSTNGIDCGGPDSIDYDASKAGVISLTKGLAKELAPGIRVNCIAPGWIETDMNKSLPKDYVKEETDRIYLKRFGKPEEIAKTILFLVS